jgi:hypothetical protein
MHLSGEPLWLNRKVTDEKISRNQKNPSSLSILGNLFKNI